MSERALGRQVRLEVRTGTLVLTPRSGDGARLSRGARALGADAAIAHLRAAIAEEPSRTWMSLDRGEALSTRAPAPGSALARVEARISDGSVVAFFERREIAPMFLVEPERAPVASAARVKHWIEYVFEYPDGEPVANLPFVLIDPELNETRGRLPSNGRIRREPARVGRWEVVLRDVVSAWWGRARARVGEEVKLRADFSGCPDGTAVKVRIFRELAEQDRDCLEELSATVEGGALELSYHWDDSAPQERREQTGKLRLVAEVSIDGGALWAKTERALEVQLKTIRSVTWYPRSAAPGDVVRLRVETSGFSEGTPVEVELFEHDWRSEPTSLGALSPEPMRGGIAELELEWEGAPEDHTGGGTGLFFVAKVKEGLEREARSDLLPLLPRGEG